LESADLFAGVQLCPEIQPSNWMGFRIDIRCFYENHHNTPLWDKMNVSPDLKW
jgi:hypothetical protein